MIGRCRAHFRKKGTAFAVRSEVTVPAAAILSCNVRQGLQIVAEPFKFGIDNWIGSIGGDNAALPAASTDRFMVAQIVERVFGRCDDFDIISLK